VVHKHYSPEAWKQFASENKDDLKVIFCILFFCGGNRGIHSSLEIVLICFIHITVKSCRAGVVIQSKVQMICIWSIWYHCHLVFSCFIKIEICLTFLVLAYPVEERPLNGRVSILFITVCTCQQSVDIVLM